MSTEYNSSREYTEILNKQVLLLVLMRRTKNSKKNKITTQKSYQYWLTGKTFYLAHYPNIAN